MYVYEYVEIRILKGTSQFIDRTQKCTQIPGLAMRQIVALERWYIAAYFWLASALALLSHKDPNKSFRTTQDIRGVSRSEKSPSEVWVLDGYFQVFQDWQQLALNGRCMSNPVIRPNHSDIHLEWLERTRNPPFPVKPSTSALQQHRIFLYDEFWSYQRPIYMPRSWQ